MKLICAAACAAVLHGAAPASAQSYPSKPVTIVVPFAAGGPADTLARMLGERMKASLGQSIVVENVAGAAGSIGVGRVVRAAPDGHTIGIGHLGTHVFNGALYNLAYDLVKDLEPIALLPSNTSVIVSKKDVPAKNLNELVAWLKANPKQASAATAGIGSIAHIASVYFGDKTGVALQIVPYRSGAAAFGDVVAGHVTLIFDQFTGGSAEMYRSGQVRPFAVTAKSRLAAVPDIPTVDEAGIPRPLCVHLVRLVGAEGHAEGHRREAQRGGRGGACRTGLSQADGRAVVGRSAARAADAASARRLPARRNREMVADDQGREYQGGIGSLRVVPRKGTHTDVSAAGFCLRRKWERNAPVAVSFRWRAAQRRLKSIWR